MSKRTIDQCTDEVSCDKSDDVSKQEELFVKVLKKTLRKKFAPKFVPTVQRLPPKLSIYRAKKIKRETKALATEAVMQLKDTTKSSKQWKEGVRELNTTLHNAKLHDVEFNVQSLLSLKTRQLRKRNQAHLSAQIKLVTNQYSPSQLARQASHAENGSGKGGMTQGHEPAEHC